MFYLFISFICRFSGWEDLVREAQDSNSGDLIHSEGTDRLSCSEGSTTPTPSDDNKMPYSQPSFNHSSFPSSHHSATKFKRPKFLDLSSSYRSRKPSFSPPGSAPQFPPYREFESKSTFSPENSAFVFDSCVPLSLSAIDHHSVFDTTEQPSGSRSLNDPAVISVSGDARDSALSTTASDHDVRHSYISDSGDRLDRRNALLKWKDVVFTPDDSDVISDAEKGHHQTDESEVRCLLLIFILVQVL